MIKAAIVGLGRWGQLLVTSVQGVSDDITFVAGVTRTPSKVEEFARQQKLSLTDELGEVLKISDIDAVVIATPHTLHAEQIMAAAQAGKHVFCEKPFTLNATETARALDVISSAGLKVATGFNRRFAPNTIELKRMLDTGELGQRLHIEGNMSSNMTTFANAWRSEPGESPAGGMTSLGMHLVDTYLHLFGSIASVSATSKRQVMPFEVDDTISIVLEFESGCTGYLSTLTVGAALWKVRAYGSGGWGELTGLDQLEYMKTDGDSETVHYDGYNYPGIRTLRTELELFAQDISGGTPFPSRPWEILHGSQILDAIIESVANGQSLKIAV